MSVERHRRLEELFHAAVERPPADRDRFLAEHCGDDADLAAEVRELLARDQATDDTMLIAPADVPPPERIGPYRILRTIGEGGFAMVYLAQQDEPLRRQVALKILKPGLDTRATLARFAAERQTLAVMNHDGIARIFDAGATERGRPYFVMEYVPGEPITAYCDRHELNTRDRLRLFTAVCEAVHHAHQKGVIHRDLKPSNVLVTGAGDSAQIKVIDFGIAKATTPDLAGQTLFTQQGQIIGTPEYMSPEQAGFGPGDVDTRTDIYSLGVILYELLAGVPPFSRETLRNAGIAEIQRIIREVDPPRPSTRVSTLGEDSEAIARRHRTAPRSLVRELRGELDWVVLKAMEKDRERRYASPIGLSKDLWRFLRDEALEARPPTARYRLRKFAWRNRLALTMAAAVMLGLLGLSAGVTVALVESNRQRAQTEAALADAEQARDEAEAVTEFLAGMMAAAQPYRQGRDVTVRDVLESTAASLETELVDRPLLANRVRRTIGTTLAELGEFERAEVLLREAVAEYDRLLGPDHPRTLRAIDEIGDVLFGTNRLDEAETLYRELYERRRELEGEVAPQTLAAMHQWGNALANQTRYAEAESLLVRSWELVQSVPDPDPQMVLSFASNLGNFYAETSRPGLAEPLLRIVLEGRIKHRGETHPEVMESWSNLAMLYADQGRYAECLPLLRRASELQDRQLGAEHQEALVARNNLAAISGLVFQWAAAESLYVEGLAAAEGHRDPGERIVQHMLNNLGYLQLQQGRFDEAEANLMRAYVLRREHMGEDHRDTYVSVNNLGELALLRGELTQAEALLVPNLAARRTSLGLEHPHTLVALVNLGRLRLAQGQSSEAHSFLTAAVDLARRTLGDSHRTTVWTACHAGRAMLDRGEHAALEAMLGPLTATADTSLAAADPLRGALRVQLAASALAADRPEEAARLLDEADLLLAEQRTRAVPWRRDAEAVRQMLAGSRND